MERSFSDLLRHPNDVAADLDTGDVLLRRRNEPDLRLSRADREAERANVFQVLATSFRSLAVHSPKVFDAAVLEAFSWSAFLPVAERRAFVEEFSSALAASAAIDTYSRLAQVVREWRATAEVRADPALTRRLKRKVIVVEEESVAAPRG